VTKSTPFNVEVGATVRSAMAVTADILIQHVQVTIHDTYMPTADTRLVLISPAGTKSVLLSQTGLVNGRDLTGGLDVSGDVITSNAFWGEGASGTWTLQIQDIGGRAIGTVKDWSLMVLGDNATTIDEPLVYTPEFAGLAVADAARTIVTPGKATAIDLIALPGPTMINLNGGAGLIDGVGVTIRPGLRNANADGSAGLVTLTGLAAGGSELTGGDGVSVLNGAGRDTLNAGFGATAINTGGGGSLVTLSSFGPSRVTVTSGGGDTIWAGLASASITNTGGIADTIHTQGASLSFINGSGAGMNFTGSGTVLFGGAGPETLRGGAGNQTLIAGSAADTMVAGQGVTTFIVGAGNDTVDAGGIADIIQIQSGWAGGQVTVTGFRIGTDFLHLTGFATTEVAVAMATKTSDGHGGSLLRFSDNTRLDLLGVSSVSRSMFA
jgi:subtilisin-like proprotein convertase family protein